LCCAARVCACQSTHRSKDLGHRLGRQRAGERLHLAGLVGELALEGGAARRRQQALHVVANRIERQLTAFEADGGHVARLQLRQVERLGVSRGVGRVRQVEASGSRGNRRLGESNTAQGGGEKRRLKHRCRFKTSLLHF
jgi:hypothetical protein